MHGTACRPQQSAGSGACELPDGARIPMLQQGSSPCSNKTAWGTCRLQVWGLLRSLAASLAQHSLPSTAKSSPRKFVGAKRCQDPDVVIHADWIP